MSLTNMYVNDWADFTINYTKDDKQHTLTGKAQVRVDYDVDYTQYEISRSYDPLVLRDNTRTTISLETVKDFKVKQVTLRSNVNKVTTTRKIIVEDFTFASISKARKKAGAPKESIFKTNEEYNDLDNRQKTVTFTWDETL